MSNSDHTIRAWVEVDLTALEQNLNFLQQHSNKQIMAILKAGAYGHGIIKIAEFLDSKNLAFFGVASVVEARLLQHLNTNLYLLGPACKTERPEIVQNRWIPSLSSLEEAQAFNDLNQGNQPLPIHLTLDTGMGRGGFLKHNLLRDISKLQQLENLSLNGIGSHLPSADEDPTFTKSQIHYFDTTVQELDTHFEFIHIANSAGILAYNSEQSNLVRPGLSLYGISPIEEYSTKLKPVMKFYSQISIIRELPKGQSISYGRETKLEKNTRVGTIGVGYGDGYMRALSHQNTEVYIHGKRCPILGRVTMDQIMVDLSNAPESQSGDKVELFGNNIPVQEIAKKANTIPWEILTGIAPRVKRIYTK